MDRLNDDIPKRFREWMELLQFEEKKFQDECLTLFFGLVRRGDILPDKIDLWSEGAGNKLVLSWEKARYQFWEVWGDGFVRLIDDDVSDEDDVFRGNQFIPISYWAQPSGHERLEQWHRKYYQFVIQDGTIETPCITLKTSFQTVSVDFDDWNRQSPLPPTIDRMIERAIDLFHENTEPRQYRVILAKTPNSPEVSQDFRVPLWNVVSLHNLAYGVEIIIEPREGVPINEPLVRESLRDFPFELVQLYEMKKPI